MGFVVVVVVVVPLVSLFHDSDVLFVIIKATQEPTILGIRSLQWGTAGAEL